MSITVNTIYNESCFETMARMPSNFIDLVVTSPPYNKAGFEGFIRKRHSTDNWSKGRNIEYAEDAENDFLDESEYQSQQIALLNELYRILKPNGSIFYNHKVRIAQHKASHPIEWILKSNLTFRQQIIWNRKSSPAIAPIRYLPSTELIFWLTKGAVQPNFKRENPLFVGEVWEFSAKQNSLHPAPFPDELPQNIMMCIEDKENIIVYDPYAGIGTTCRIAKRFGFNYIGSEIVKKYVDNAESSMQSLLFC